MATCGRLSGLLVPRPEQIRLCHFLMALVGTPTRHWDLGPAHVQLQQQFRVNQGLWVQKDDQEEMHFPV